MIRIVLPPLPAVAADGRANTLRTTLLRCVTQMVRAEAWQTVATFEHFAFDPSAMPDPPHTFTSSASRLARALHGCWAPVAEPIPRTINSDGATESAWPGKAAVPLFVVDTAHERRLVYLADGGFATARFSRRRAQVRRHGRYTTGVLGGRTARAVAETIAEEALESSSLALWPLDPPCATPYSVLARTLLSMAAIVFDATAPELRSRMAAVDFASLMADAVAHLTVGEVHAY